ncbi:MAG: phosphoserine phosphatase SerB [Candidatus Bathyarchaeales archaeon]
MFLVAIDFDGVLVKGEYLPELAKIVGKSGEIEKITKDGIEGRISWRESLKKRIELLKGVEYEKCVKAAENLEIREGAKEFLDSLRKLGKVKIGVITGCFDIAVNPVKEKLGLDFAVANKFIFNDGKLAGVEIIVDTNKDEHMERIAKQYGIKMENVIAIGDGANDINMISKAALGIAFNSTPILKGYSKAVVHSERLDEALPVIEAFIREREEHENTLNLISKEKLKVLVCDPIDPEGVELLRKFGFEISVEPEISKEDLKNKVAECNVLIVRSRTKVTKEIIDAGKNLKIIARAGAGVDNIDVEYAEKKGIRVVCAPEAVSAAVAELTIGLMLSLARQIPRAEHAMKEGKWIKGEIEGWELQGKTLGIVGFGRIGQKVAKLAKAFGMNIMICELNSAPEHLLKELDAEIVPLKEILRKSDIITFHVPLTQETYHMIGKKEIEQMKNGVYIINTSRGPIIDENALLEALKTGKIAGAALDVYEKEPPNDFTLMKLPNVVCTPHIGAQTVEAQKYASIIVAQKIISIVKHALENTCDFKCQECDKF